MGKMQRNKGARGEREVKDLHNEFFSQHPHLSHHQAKRNSSTQSDGGGYDLIGIPNIALEVKFQEALTPSNINAWWQQTLEQVGPLHANAGLSSPARLPVLFYRKSRVPWRVRTLGQPLNPNMPFKDYPVVCIDISVDDYFEFLSYYLAE